MQYTSSYQNDSLIRLPKISNKSQSTSSTIKSQSYLNDQISSKSWLCITPNNQLGYRPSIKLPIASITKTLTCLVSIQICQKYKINIKNAYFKITSWSTQMNGTSAQLHVNQWMSIQDLMYGLMLPSGNDAAMVLAENLGAVIYFDKSGNHQMIKDVRSIDLTQDQDSIKYYMNEFILCMNQKAKSIKMLKSKFANPHGLDHINNYSCCEDILLLSKQAMKSSLFQTIVSTYKYRGTFKTFKDKKIISRYIVWTNTNKLLDSNKNIVFGIKTGITPKAGGCLVTYFKFDNDNYGYIVVLGASSAENRFRDTQILLNHIQDIMIDGI